MEQRNEDTQGRETNKPDCYHSGIQSVEANKFELDTRTEIRSPGKRNNKTARELEPEVSNMVKVDFTEEEECEHRREIYKIIKSTGSKHGKKRFLRNFIDTHGLSNLSESDNFQDSRRMQCEKPQQKIKPNKTFAWW